MIRRSMLVVSLALVGCLKTPDPEMPQPPPPYELRVCHTDPGFDEEHREHIRNAGTAWAILTNNQTVFSTPEDLDFNNARSLSACTIVKTTSEHPLIMTVQDRPENRRLNIQAVTVGQRVYVAMDRIHSGQEFHWIMVHELGHTLGLKDLTETGHVMSGAGPFAGDFLDAADKAECARVHVRGCE